MVLELKSEKCWVSTELWKISNITVFSLPEVSHSRSHPADSIVEQILILNSILFYFISAIPAEYRMQLDGKD